MAHATNGKAAGPARRQRPAAAAAAPSQTAADGGRGPSGRFLEGNKFSKGNPFSRKLALFRAAFLAGLDAAKLERLGNRLYELAVSGDVSACELLLKYALGKPREAVDPDGLDHDEFRQLIAGPSLAQAFYAWSQTCDPGLAAAVWRALAAGDVDALREQVDRDCRTAPQTFNKFFQAEGTARAGRA
jgi:hypothetical protein